MTVKLCKYDEEFLHKSYEWLTNPYIKRTTNAPDITREGQKKWFNSLSEKKDYFIWGIRYENMPVGACGLKNVHDGTAECWWYIGERSVHGKGIGFCMANLVLDKAKEMNLQSIWCKVLLDNQISANLLKKIGFAEYERDDRNIYMRKIMEGNDKHEQHVIRTIVWGGVNT
jgi:RimJ/RimL family protein N-acetyltransferase